MRRIEIIGNLGKDAELKNAGGHDVLNFSVAAKGSRKDSESMWFRCAVWGRRATALREYLTKGKPVFVRGDLSTREWTDKEGAVHTEHEVNADEVELLGGGKSQGDDNPYGG